MRSLLMLALALLLLALMISIPSVLTAVIFEGNDRLLAACALSSALSLTCNGAMAHLFKD